MKKESYTGILDYSHAAPDTVPSWMVYAGVKETLNNGLEGINYTLLIDDRVVHFNDKDHSGPSRRLHITVAETEAAKRSLNTVIELPGKKVQSHYFYSRPDFYDERPRLVVYECDGSKTQELLVESAGAVYEGNIDERGIDSKYNPAQETIEITCINPKTGLRTTICFNRVSGDGTVEVRRTDGQIDTGWILKEKESKETTESIRQLSIRQVGRVAEHILHEAA